jgi:uncharacterized Tic20 family protein
MTKTNGGEENSGGEQVDRPVGADQGDRVQTSWVTGEIAKDARMWAMFCHLGGLAGISAILPAIGSIVVPLVIWQIKRDESPFVDEQGRRAVNFQISMLLYALIGSVVCLATCVGIPLIPVVICVVYVVDLGFVLTAAVKASSGRHYRYPLTIRFIK